MENYHHPPSSFCQFSARLFRNNDHGAAIHAIDWAGSFGMTWITTGTLRGTESLGVAQCVPFLQSCLIQRVHKEANILFTACNMWAWCCYDGCCLVVVCWISLMPRDCRLGCSLLDIIKYWLTSGLSLAYLCHKCAEHIFMLVISLQRRLSILVLCHDAEAWIVMTNCGHFFWLDKGLVLWSLVLFAKAICWDCVRRFVKKMLHSFSVLYRQV